MKQTAQNTFQDGMNLDLHPIVTPNSVLTDNLNGTFITYNGNEFCLQNDRGNVLKASLKEGFVPIGIKEHNGVLYIVSCNENGEGEIGTYPGLDWDNSEIEKQYDLDYSKYTPLKTLINNEGTISELCTNKFNFNLKNPVTIEVQDSYDGSINLILTDNKNKPRLINTGFSVTGNKYKIIKKTTDDFLVEDTLENQIELIKSVVSFARFNLKEITQSGQLKGGNYTFYAKFGDLDGNQTDIVCESGIVSIFNGTIGKPNTISGTLGDELTDKAVHLSILNVDDNYNKVYLYYVREYSDTQGFLMTEAIELTEPFNVENGVCNIIVTGVETTNSISVEDLNINYHTVNSAKTIAQQQDMLFLANVKHTEYDVSELDSLAKTIKTGIAKGHTLESLKMDYSNNGEYYNVENIYRYVGYWPGEYYRFGIVFILADGSKTSVYNMNGGSLELGETCKNNFEGELYSNTKGVFHVCKENILANKTVIGDKITPWCFKFDCSELKEAVNQRGLSDTIKGYFIVRQKRIPEVIVQGLRININSITHTPVIKWPYFNSTDYLYEEKDTMQRFIAYNSSTKNRELYYWQANSFIETETNTIKWYKINLPQNNSIYLKLFLINDGIGSAEFLETMDSTEWKELTVTDYGSGRIYVGYPNSTGKMYTNVSISTDVQTFLNYTYTLPHDFDDHSTVINCILSVIYSFDLNQNESLDTQFKSSLLQTVDDDPGIGMFSLEATLSSSMRNLLDGSEFSLDEIRKVYSISESGKTNSVSQAQVFFNTTFNNTSEETKKTKCVYVNTDNIGKVVSDRTFATVVGSAYDASAVKEVETAQSKEKKDIYESDQTESNRKNYNNIKRLQVIRGRFAPYVALADISEQLDSHSIVQISNRNANPGNAVNIRVVDNSPYYCVSERYPIANDNVIDVYRGDCFVVTETIRVNNNFIDPSYPYTDRIVKPNCWEDNYKGEESDETTDWTRINLTDVNTVSLGLWVTFKCLASSNLSLRAEDPFDTIAMSTMGNPKSFFPLNKSTSTAGKQLDSELFNAGYGITVDRVRNQQYIETPYVKQEYSNRVMFSNKQVINQFLNGYRVFQGLSYHDYDKQYGSIIKLVPWENNLFCVMEHGLGLIGVNEQALLQTNTEQTVHIYGHDVLSRSMTIISQDFGSKYADSVIRTPIAIYGIDVDAKKIWKFSKEQGFQTISDIKVESFLNETLNDHYNINIITSDVRTHYNIFKGDLIFTWYDEDNSYSICYNERQDKWTTRYNWLPIVSENRNGEFYSLQKGVDSTPSVGIYSHEIENSTPTKWYGKQQPFEFEFVVSDPIGVHKIFENLQIISNNVQPEELQFEFIGDAYLFNKARIYHTTFDNTALNKFANPRKFGHEITEDRYDKDPKNNLDGFTKPNIASAYRPFRNASILNDRNNTPVFGKVEKTLNATNQYHLIIPQECRNIETWGRRLGNIQYKEDCWYTNIEPLIYDSKLLCPNEILTNDNIKWGSARIRDKWCKIRVRYSGEDLAVITAIKTIVNI